MMCETSPTPEMWKKRAAAAGLALFLALASVTAPPLAAQEDDPYLEAALESARWLRSQVIYDTKGRAWPAHADRPETVSNNLYSGISGVVLFFVEAYRTTGKPNFREQARRGSDYLMTTLSRKPKAGDFGLYTGVPGIGVALLETFKITADERYRRGAKICVQILHKNLRKAGKGLEWNDSTDIISGIAGTGLFLLTATRELFPEDLGSVPFTLELAEGAGDRLMELGKPEHGGTKWAMNEEFPRLMPNFSHGTAGVSYFLASLYQETGKKKYLDAALAGARYLIEVAEKSDGQCLVFHDEPDGKDLFYLGWCHGPAGTGRLFYRLYQATGDDQWITWLEKSAQAIMATGIPEKRTPGFWNNVGQCCGSAGVAEFFLSLHMVLGKDQYLELARKLAKDLLERGTRTEKGMFWVQAEHRVKPDLLVAQTGYMQGAAGIGMLLLHLYNYDSKKETGIVLPDSPFPKRM